jgi:hypothetical protein
MNQNIKNFIMQDDNKCSYIKLVNVMMLFNDLFNIFIIFKIVSIHLFFDMTLNLEVIVVCVILYLQQNGESKCLKKFWGCQ